MAFVQKAAHSPPVDVETQVPFSQVNPVPQGVAGQPVVWVTQVPFEQTWPLPQGVAGQVPELVLFWHEPTCSPAAFTHS